VTMDTPGHPTLSSTIVRFYWLLRCSASDPRNTHPQSLAHRSSLSSGSRKMKRSRDAMEGQCDKQRRRQECVSCQFCRSKKLKCDRQFPCSNCRARRLICASSGRTSELSEGAANSSQAASASPATCEAATISDSSNTLKYVKALLLWMTCIDGNRTVKVLMN
jgi:hypothetical protein